TGPAHILQHRDREVYVHYIGADKRLDEWVAEERCFIPTPNPPPFRASLDPTFHSHPAGPSTTNRQPQFGVNQTASTSAAPAQMLPPGQKAQTSTPREMVMTEEEYDIHQHKQITANRNFEYVYFGEWQGKTWYFSPYPLTETEIDDPTSSDATPKIPGVTKATARSHGRTSDLLAGGLLRGATGPGTEKAQLWVCQQCFKYMSEWALYENHTRFCTVDYPPGRRVYQRGAHTIWEVDGAQQKLYCQNLALFGKLFIDVKTLFFDLDNFLFYILTESTTKQDHILGYFSKEKNSYDEYNLATIMTLPPYQRKGYGMLMIEFSYELSRRTGKIGTPERPLSDLGLRSYLAYWVSTLIRFFRHVLSVLPSNTLRITHLGQFPGLQRTSSSDGSGASSSPGNGNGSSNGNGSNNGNQAANANGNLNGSTAPRKKKNKLKGWAGEVEDANVDQEEVPFLCDDPMFSTHRPLVTEHSEDGSAATHVMVSCQLADIARATNLRVDDAAFALNEVGLLAMRIASEGDDGDDGDKMGTVVLTRAMVEKVATERSVKRPCMRMPFVRLP
ncbi:putative MYST-like histone acetyltransferase 1, partial [Termitomyces sp. J132]